MSRRNFAKPPATESVAEVMTTPMPAVVHPFKNCPMNFEISKGVRRSVKPCGETCADPAWVPRRSESGLLSVISPVMASSAPLNCFWIEPKASSSESFTPSMNLETPCTAL